MKYLLGEKINMTQIFDETGTVYPVTVIKTSPLTVTQVKAAEKDGYSAVQIAIGTRHAKNVTKALQGHFKKAGDTLFRHVREFRTDTHEYKVGDTIDLGIFEKGEEVVVTGTSKGKGFQGVVKRHGFKGGPRTHGQKHSEREPGSISGGTRNGGRVPKGMRMAGRMGGDRITEKNHKVIDIDTEKGLIFIEGAVPGRRGSLVEIKA